jgi:hypothetical protein
VTENPELSESTLEFFANLVEENYQLKEGLKTIFYRLQTLLRENGGIDGEKKENNHHQK